MYTRNYRQTPKDSVDNSKSDNGDAKVKSERDGADNFSTISGNGNTVGDTDTESDTGIVWEAKRENEIPPGYRGTAMLRGRDQAVEAAAESAESFEEASGADGGFTATEDMGRADAENVETSGSIKYIPRQPLRRLRPNRQTRPKKEACPDCDAGDREEQGRDYERQCRYDGENICPQGSSPSSSPSCPYYPRGGPDKECENGRGQKQRQRQWQEQEHEHFRYHGDKTDRGGSCDLGLVQPEREKDREHGRGGDCNDDCGKHGHEHSEQFENSELCEIGKKRPGFFGLDLSSEDLLLGGLIILLLNEGADDIIIIILALLLISGLGQ